MASRHSPTHHDTSSNTLTSHAPIRRNLFAHQTRLPTQAQTHTQASRATSGDQSSNVRLQTQPRRPPQTAIPSQHAPASTATVTPTPAARNKGNVTVPDQSHAVDADGTEDNEDDEIMVRDEEGRITMDGFDNVSVTAMSLMMRGPGGISARVAGIGMDDDEEEDSETGYEINDTGDEDSSNRRVDTKLIELYRSHSQQHIDQTELKAQVQASLRAKVASLDDDNWMFEEEEEDHEGQE